ncbi:MAG TPA: tyrosine-protein phosphatase [Sporichthyaceae bacterium]
MTDLHVNHSSIPGARGAAADPSGRLRTVAGLHNLRDLGGYPVAGGGRTRWGLLFRGGVIGALSPTTEAEMIALGLRTVVDLRDDQELIAPQLDETAAVTAHRNPIYLERIGAYENQTLEALYGQILTLCAAEIAASVEALAAPEALPGLVHCSVGKDRTGLVIGILLSAIGVPDAVVVEDYARTEELLTPADRERMLRRAEEMGLPTERAEMLMGSPPHVMQASLDTMRESHADARSYLLAHGVRPESLDALRVALVDPDA